MLFGCGGWTSESLKLVSKLAQLATPLTSRVEPRDSQTWTLTPSSLKYKLRFFNLHFSVFVNLI